MTNTNQSPMEACFRAMMADADGLVSPAMEGLLRHAFLCGAAAVFSVANKGYAANGKDGFFAALAATNAELGSEVARITDKRRVLQ